MADRRQIFSEIYDQYVEKIYRFIFFKVSSREVAEDLTSETFLKAWRVFKEENPGIKNIQAFLYKIAKNLLVDYYRQRDRVKVLSVDSIFISDPKQNLEEKAMLNSDIEMVKKALTDLKEDYQNAIIWYYLDDLPISKIAQLLDRTEEATRVLIHRALTALKKKIEQV